MKKVICAMLVAHLVTLGISKVSASNAEVSFQLSSVKELTKSFIAPL